MNTATDMLSPLERLLGLPTQAQWDAGMGLNPKQPTRRYTPKMMGHFEDPAVIDSGSETVLMSRLERELLAQSRRGNVDLGLGDDFDARLQQEVDDHHGVSLDEIFREHGKRLEQFCVPPRIGDSPEIVGYFQDIPMTRDQDGHLIALEPGQHLGMSEAAIEDFLGIKEQPAGSGMLSALPLTPVRSEPKAMKIPYPTLGDYLKPVPLPSPTKLQLFISKLFYPEPKQVFEPYRPLKKQNGRLYIDDCPHFQEKIQDTPAKRALMFLRDVPDQITYDLLALKGLSTIIVDAVVDESGTLSPNAIRELEQEGYFILYNTHGYLDKDNNRQYLLHLHCERFQAVLMESIDPLFGD